VLQSLIPVKTVSAKAEVLALGPMVAAALMTRRNAMPQAKRKNGALCHWDWPAKSARRSN
jgi:hypothetical protein